MANKLGCPHCGNTSGFKERNIVCVDALINEFNIAGEPDYAGESEVNWDSQIIDEKAGDELYMCEQCYGTFAKPVAVRKRGRK